MGHTVLIGLRGVGKTTAGRALASLTSRPFIDLDDIVLRRLGSESVRDVFAERGEAAWRAGEADALAALLEAPLGDSVIALGGGAPMIGSVAQRLTEARERGNITVVHLTCDTDVAAARLAATPGDRPSVTGRGVVEELRALADARHPHYRALCDCEVDANGAPEVVVARINEQLGDRAAARGDRG